MDILSGCVDFLQRLIQSPGLPGEEEATARLVHREMEILGYDDVYTDEAGNVIGFIKGRGEAPSVMFNTHLDHVDVGMLDAWPYPPFGGELYQDCVWGRGAVDIKGPLAAQVYGMSRLLTSGMRPPGDVYVSAVVYEELGGLGARHLRHHIDIPLIVVGEPSGNALYRGHRGRIELIVHVKGRSAHASAPNRGANPLYVMASFLERLNQVSMNEDPDLGSSSVAPTLIKTDQRSANVIPGELWLTLDWRNIPGETENDICSVLQPVLDACVIEGTTGSISAPRYTRRSYTGLTMDIPASMPPFVTRENDPSFQAARDVLESLWEAPPNTGFWQFATDGGNFDAPGVTCIGFGPGDESLAHTIDEHIPIKQLNTALAANEALATRWPQATQHQIKRG